MESCFLCAKENHDNTFSKIQTAEVAASRKPLELVLQHLANCIKIKLVFHENATLCPTCLKEIADYDYLMLKLLECQRKLTRQLEAAVTGKTNVCKEEFISIKDETETETVTDQTVFSQAGDIVDMDDFIMEEATVVAEDDSEESGSDSELLTRARRKQECIVCGIMFTSKSELNIHVAQEHAPKPFICKICGVARRDEEYLELHMNIHEGKTENECRYCPKRFSRPVNTIRHMRKHWDKKKFQCEKCGERFSLDNMLYNHRMRHEAEENPIICSICNQTFKSRKTFNHHMHIHQENRRRHYCTLCSKSFTERYTLKMHMKTHGHDSMDASMIVAATEVIDYKETEESVKMIMEDDQSPGGEQEYSCVICSVKYENKEHLDRHLQFDHDVILK